MKLLFDEKLPPSLSQSLAELFPGSTHVHECGLGATDDADIWAFAAQHGFVIVSKDSDFEHRSILFGSPLKVIWLRVGNCSVVQIAELLRRSAATIREFGSASESLF